MRTVHRYLAVSFLVSFCATVLVISFVMTLGVVFKITDLIARGAPVGPLMGILAWGFPSAMAYAIPISALVATLLVFGRLSSDGEITALKVCGISMWQIIRIPVLLSVCLSVVCLYLNNELGPRSHFERRRLMKEMGVETPIELLDEGKFITEFPNLLIRIDRKDGVDLQGVKIYDLRSKPTRLIQAARGRVSTNATQIILDLYDASGEPAYEDLPFEGGHVTIAISNELVNVRYEKREEDLTLGELWYHIEDIERAHPEMNVEDRARERRRMTTEIHKRFVLAVSCVAFVILGVPLGIRAHRKESSIGVAISLMVVFNFYLFVIVAESLAKRPPGGFFGMAVFRPEVIVWMPMLISVALGSYLIHRGN